SPGTRFRTPVRVYRALVRCTAPLHIAQRRCTVRYLPKSAQAQPATLVAGGDRVARVGEHDARLLVDAQGADARGAVELAQFAAGAGEEERLEGRRRFGGRRWRDLQAGHVGV